MTPRLLFIFALVWVPAHLGGCAGASDDETKATSLRADAASEPDVGTRPTASADGGHRDVRSPPVCDAVSLGRVCVRGRPAPGGMERLEVGSQLRLEAFPSGCYSSSCTAVDEARCAVSLDGQAGFGVVGSFCLRDTTDPVLGCSADCSGGIVAECGWSEPLTEGSHVIRHGGAELVLTVPGVVPGGGACL